MEHLDQSSERFARFAITRAVRMSTWPVWRLDTWLQASLALEVPAAGARALLHDLLLMDSTTESDSSTLEPSMGSKGIPFQELKLTVDEQQNCRDRSFQLLDRTLRSYDERDGQEDNGRPSDPLHHSNLDNTRWKQLKTQESASLYVERSNSMHRDDNILGGDWINPMVFLMAGTIQGELDEVMLGVETPIVASLRDRKEILAMQPVDCAVLSELAGPTESDPFQYIGIQWMAFKHGWPLKAVSSPRDFVTLASKGTMTRANGDRIGYQVVQPAKLPQCPPLPGSMRTNLMYAAIFKQQEPGIVDVFVLTYIETLSALLNKVVVSATWKSTMDLWSAPQLAEMKKMQWCLANCKAQRRQLQRQASPSAKNVCKRCLEIRKVRGSDIEDKTACVLCVSPTCSNCRVDRTLEAIDERKLKLIEHSVVVCRACMVFVQHMRPVDIAARIIGCFVLRRIVCDARCTWLMPTSDSENVAYTRDKLRYLNPANCTRAVVAESPVTAMATRSSGASTTATSWPLPNSVRSRIPTQIPRSQR
ncbi:hypothetical protein PC114_g20063 [Phytophthora cactorum]|nr:hypothetical protein PC114_g20063 [Phytophthora cactorum]KAG3066272.1 hypothetical protein PC122_g17866 [Phytophthora cactorum]KAG3132753.1 hypothetical protein C6341_g22782 [Phytophthora cactorum]